MGRTLFLVLFLVSFIFPALAIAGSAQKSLGTFGVWQTYSYTDGDQPVCYMVKPAHIPAPKNKKFKRGAAYLMITHRPGENSKDVVSYTSGYNFKSPSDVTVHIGKDTFDLFTQKDSAWSRDTKTDHALVAAIRSNGFMKVVGSPAQNVSVITDTLDLKGSAAAYQAIGKACGLELENPPKTPAKQGLAAKKKHN
jgi:hypothetical protein